MAYVRCSNGGGTTSLKDFYRNKVLNGGFTSFATFQSGTRATLVEGDAVVDTANRRVWVYAEFNTLVDRASPSDWSTILMTSTSSTTYMPKYKTSSRSNNVGLICDESSDRNYAMNFGFGSSVLGLILGYGDSLYKNEHVIVYGSWTY